MHIKSWFILTYRPYIFLTYTCFCNNLCHYVLLEIARSTGRHRPKGSQFMRDGIFMIIIHTELLVAKIKSCIPRAL